MPLPLWAEHGFWHRQAPGAASVAAAPIDTAWKAKLVPILKAFHRQDPGIADRNQDGLYCVAFQRRAARIRFPAGARAQMLLGDALSNQPIEVLEGRKVIEVRFRGISKATVAHQTPAGCDGHLTVAFGDDRTDEDLFHALPASSITIAVGQPLTGARYRINGYRAVRQLLRSFACDSARDAVDVAVM